MPTLPSLPRPAAMLAAVLVLAGVIQVPAAQNQNAEQENDNSLRYYVHVSGITCPTCLTNVVKQLRQVAGVAGVKVQDFKKGVFAVTPQRGASFSHGALWEAVRRSGFTPEKIVPSKKPNNETPSATAKEETSEAEVKVLAPARQAFWQGDYPQALRLVRRAAAKNLPDSQVQQFLSLAFFSVGNYPEAALAAHAAVDRGDAGTGKGRRPVGLGRHWDWKTMSRYYADPRDYTPQLRALEKHVQEKPSEVQARFLLGYHYLMLGYSEAARHHLSRVAKLDPKDELPARLLRELDKTHQISILPQPKAPTKEEP